MGRGVIFRYKNKGNQSGFFFLNGFLDFAFFLGVDDGTHSEFDERHPNDLLHLELLQHRRAYDVTVR